MNKKIYTTESIIVENRFMFISALVSCVVILIVIRLWYMQIYKGDEYRRISENNRIRKIEIPSPRGIIYDRNGSVVLGNRPFFDMVLIPQYVKDVGKTFDILSSLLHIPKTSLERRYRAAQGRPRFLPVVLKRNLNLHEVSIVQSNKVFLPGIEVNVAPRRDYKGDTPAHMVGYLGEIDSSTLKEINKNQSNEYLPGDLLGKHGLEARFENYLRGRRGYRFIEVDAFGRQVRNADRTQYLNLPEVASIPGSDLVLTIDLDLQKAAQEAFKGKNGAIVALNPQNGEVLALLSEPQFDPTIYQDGLSHENWQSLISDPFNPLLDKTTGGSYPPGSTFKIIVAMAGLEEKRITTDTTYFCPGHFTVNGQVFHCWERAGHGRVNVIKAIMKSCDVFFYQLASDIGVDKIAKYAQALGLGEKLGLNLNAEGSGLVPTSAWKMKKMRQPWTYGDTPNMAIGQGFNLMTPLQMASLYATVSNNGTVWKPYLVKRVINNFGQAEFEQEKKILHEAKFSPETFKIIKNALTEVVQNPEGSGKNAQVPGHIVAGKTGSAQVVSLKKNLNRTDVSVKWKEHAMFAAFSPVENPEIAVAVVSEHDSVGGGGRSAAPIAQKIIKAYYDLKEQRASLQAKSESSQKPAEKVDM